MASKGKKRGKGFLGKIRSFTSSGKMKRAEQLFTVQNGRTWKRGKNT